MAFWGFGVSYKFSKKVGTRVLKSVTRRNMDVSCKQIVPLFIPEIDSQIETFD
jgi:hypothetical protein